MLTKGYITELPAIGDNIYKVRLPIFEQAGITGNKVTSSEFCATVSHDPGNLNAYRVGDCVYVGFEDNNYSSAVIIGLLDINDEREATTYALLNALRVNGSATLPADTKIGNINFKSLINDLSQLKTKEDKLPTYVVGNFLHVSEEGYLDWVAIDATGKVKSITLNNDQQVFEPDESGNINLTGIARSITVNDIQQVFTPDESGNIHLTLEKELVNDAALTITKNGNEQQPLGIFTANSAEPVDVDISFKTNELIPWESGSEYIDLVGQRDPNWGDIQGDIKDQTDLIQYIDTHGGSIKSITINNTAYSPESGSANVDLGYYVTESGMEDYVESYHDNTKVDKETGKGLSTNDYTTFEKNKLSGIESGAEVNVQADWNITDANSDAYIKNKPSIPAAQVNSDWNASSGVAQILNKPNLASVATSGSYNDLTNKPTIPTVNNGTLTITKNSDTQHPLVTFSANAASNTSANITFKTNELIVWESGSEFIDLIGDTASGGGETTDVQINGSSITSQGIANIQTETAYNAYTNKIATMSDLPAEVTETTVTNWGFTKNQGTVTSVNNVSPVNGNVTIAIPAEVTETTVTNWGFTKNEGTVKSVNNTQPDASGNVSLTIPQGDNQTIKVKVNGSDVVFGANDIVELKAGNNVSITPDTGNKTVTIASTATPGSSTDVQINGTSIVSGNAANILTQGTYNESSNKIATMSDLPPTITISTGNTKSVSDGTNTLTFGSNAFNSTTIPTTYIKSTSSSGNTLTITKQDNTTTTFTPTFTEQHVGDVVSLTAESGSHISIGGTTAIPTISIASGYSIPSTSDQTTWSGKQNALPTTTTAGKVLKSTSTAGTVEWGDAPAIGVTDVKIGNSSIVSSGIATLQTNSTYNASTNKIATMSDVPTESTVSGWGFTKNTGNVTGSSLTSNKIIIGDGSSAISASTYQPASSSTTWSDSSDVYLPTMKAINNAGFVKSSGVTSVATGVGLTGGTITDTGTIKANLVNETKSTNAASYTAGGSSKFYAVQIDKNDKLGVYVPWSTVNNATLTIQKNGTTVNTFTANASSNVTANIAVPVYLNDMLVQESGSEFIDLVHVSNVIPDCPTTTDGTFELEAVVLNGSVTYRWVAKN